MLSSAEYYDMEEFMRRIFLIIMAAVFLISGCSGLKDKNDTQKDSGEIVTREVFAMDTYMTLKAYGNTAAAAMDEACNIITLLENRLSVTVENSDVWNINHSDGNTVHICDDTVKIIDKAIEIGNATDGALDITIYPVLKEWGFTTGEYKVPDSKNIAALLKNVDFRQIVLNKDEILLPQNFQVDLGALAKGYTGDRVMEVFKENGITSAVISLGGNVSVLGTKPDGSLWKIGIRNPFSSDGNMGVLSAADKTIITSGSYERYFTDENGNKYWHILDTKSGYPADSGLVSVTVIGDDGLKCDALSTALFAMGREEAEEYWNENRNFEMILVTADKCIYITEGISDSFKNQSGMKLETIQYK